MTTDTDTDARPRGGSHWRTCADAPPLFFGFCAGFLWCRVAGRWSLPVVAPGGRVCASPSAAARVMGCAPNTVARMVVHQQLPQPSAAQLRATWPHELGPASIGRGTAVSLHGDPGRELERRLATLRSQPRPRPRTGTTTAATARAKLAAARELLRGDTVDLTALRRVLGT